ncbi:transposase-like protein [Labrenzia sp. EL_132]|nr:transposase-like protein [Labrenzia sp. EL_132]
MGTSNFSDDFKRDAVAQITECGYSHVMIVL